MSDAAAAPEGAVNILLVDDRPTNLMALRALLQRPDYNLVLATSGEAALSEVLRQDFALVVLDVAMPGMDGFQVAATIKGREQSRQIPIIFLTASVYDMEHIFRGYTVGAVDYLRKPLDAHAVRAKVSVFVQLFRQRKEIERQAVRLREVELRQADAERSRVLRELEQGIRARDDFLSIAAHELKTPVTPLRLQAERLLRQAQRGERIEHETLVQGLASIERATLHLTQLTERLLDVSRASVGLITLEPEEVDLAEIARDVVRREGRKAEDAGAPLVLRTPEGPLRGFFDRVRILQVLENLLSNAIKYGGGAPVEVSVSDGGDVARLEVRDHGRGIPPEDHERIFERFERVAPPRHRSGFGLGLWVTRQVIEAHRGRIAVRSRPGEGATFTVELPLRHARGQSSAIAEEARP
jgi:signal transduction histidine kinase